MESVQAKWEELFGEKEEERSQKEEEPKVKKPRETAVTKGEAGKLKTMESKKRTEFKEIINDGKPYHQDQLSIKKVVMHIGPL